MNPPAAAAALIAVAVLAGCGVRGGAANDQPPSGVSGVVWLAPTCPVEEQGQPCDAARAAAASVILARPDSAEQDGIGDVVARGRTDAQGRFRIAVAPGTYVVSSDAGMFCKPAQVQVARGVLTRLDLSCDTGIR